MPGIESLPSACEAIAKSYQDGFLSERSTGLEVTAASLDSQSHMPYFNLQTIFTTQDICTIFRSLAVSLKTTSNLYYQWFYHKQFVLQRDFDRVIWTFLGGSQKIRLMEEFVLSSFLQSSFTIGMPRGVKRKTFYTSINFFYEYATKSPCSSDSFCLHCFSL